MLFVAPIVPVVGIEFDAACGQAIEHDTEELVPALPKLFYVKADMFPVSALKRQT
jgi:hypothetical protein